MRLLAVSFLLIFINPIVQTEILCDPPANIENGKVSYSSLDFDAELHYECNSGFFLKNDQRRICSADGTWSGSEPTCQEVECAPPASPEHGAVHMIEDKLHVGSMVIYTCNEGRILVGSASSRCLDRGEWTFPPPICRESCLVPKVEHGKIGRYMGDSERKFEELPERSKIEDNEELYLRCESNYQPFGKPGDEKKVSCSQGEWEAVPVCKSVHCYVKELNYPGLLKGDKTIYKTGEVFNVTCELGFNLTKGNGQLKCVDGVWQGHVPPCVSDKFCDPPANIENGNVSYSSLRFEAELHYECNFGFVLKNNQKRICSADGTWSGSEPTCREPCFVPKIEHGKIGRYVGPYYRRKFQELPERNKIEDNEELYLRCEPNYEPFGKPDDEKKVICSEGKWEASPVCKPAMCRGPPPTILNGFIMWISRLHGGYVIHYCNRYARKMTYGNVTCLFGSWKGVTPVCKDLRCFVKDLGFPGLIEGNKTTYRTGEIFNVTCEDGYNLGKENNQLKCIDGNWQSLPPCIAASCNDEDLAESEGVVGSIVLPLNGEHSKVRCQEGYSPSGKMARCSREQWNATEKLCKESSCTIHRIDNGGFIQRVQKREGNWFTGYRYRDEYQRKFCLRRHTEILICLPISRFRPFLVVLHDRRLLANFWRISTNLMCLMQLGETRNPGSSVYVFCDGRYIFQGKKESSVLVTCSKGKWYPDPVCLILSCAKFNETEGMSISYTNGLDEGSIATFYCLVPRIRSGVSRTTCLPNGEWADPPAQCTLPSCSLDKLFDLLPVNVVPVMENGISVILPYNYSTSLICAENMRLIGSNVAKCGQDGTWQTSKIQCLSSANCSKFDETDFVIYYDKEQAVNSTAMFSCIDPHKRIEGTHVVTCLSNGEWSGSPPKCKSVSGCGFPKTENSEMIIEPDKNFYRFGESVFLSCSPGYFLSSDVVRLMCLGTAWSETVMPECVKE